MIKTLTLSLFLCFIFMLSGCKSSYFQPSEVDIKPTIVNKVVHIENMNGYKQKVKEMHYDENNTLREETFYKNQLTDIIKTYNSDGYLIKEEKYKNGNILIGQRKIYFKNGNIKEQYDFSGNNKHGRYFSYYNDGALQSDQKYNNNNLAGNCTWYYPSGNVMKIVNFRSDENYQVDYYENGEKKSEGAFIGENFVGKWIWYDKQGVISKEEFYKERN